MKTHRHICGDSGFLNKFVFNPNYGCGHIFKHTKSKEHKCPKCKRPVSKMIVTDKDLEEFYKQKQLL